MGLGDDRALAHPSYLSAHLPEGGSIWGPIPVGGTCGPPPHCADVRRIVGHGVLIAPSCKGNKGRRARSYLSSSVNLKVGLRHLEAL